MSKREQERLKTIQEFIKKLEEEIFTPKTKRLEGPSPDTEILESENARLLIHLN